MKLKRVLSLCLAAATVATCSSVVSAADENTTSFGTPISLTTGAEVEELTAGDFIAIPVDVTTSTGTLTSWTPRVVLSDALEAGVEDSAMSDDQYANLEALGGEIVTNDAGMDYYVKNIFKSGRKKTYLGTWNVNPKQEITACVHADGTTTYEFPVRVNSATGATDSITVDVYATTTADEAGATTSTDKKIGSINLTMDGTVTSYNTVNGTIAK